MPIALPSIRVGEPLRHGPLTVFPLFGDLEKFVDYRLSVDALADGSVTIEEAGEEGLVTELEVENRGGVPVLFLEGEELVGAKQDRVVNTSILVAPGCRMRMPVSCVEQGRWAYRSHRIMESGVHSPSVVRYALKSSVSMSLGDGHHPISNQAEVWDSVAKLHAGHDVASHTGAMGDTFDKYEEEVDRYRASLGYPPRARGLAVAVEDRLVAIDLFDKANTCEKVWDRLLSGAVLDSLLAPGGATEISPVAVETMLEAVWDAIWEPVETVGEGQEFRAELGRGHASALSYRGTVVHESLVLG